MGMAEHLVVMYAAVILAVGAMIWAAVPLGNFIRKYPTVKMLALSFLLLIGMTLIADGFGYHIPRGFIYSAIGFSLRGRGAEPLGAAQSAESARGGENGRDRIGLLACQEKPWRGGPPWL